MNLFRPSYRALMRKAKPELVNAYLYFLDMTKPATPDACQARDVLQKTETKLLTPMQELGLLRRWYEGTKHLIGSDQ